SETTGRTPPTAVRGGSFPLPTSSAGPSSSTSPGIRTRGGPGGTASSGRCGGCSETLRALPEPLGERLGQLPLAQPLDRRLHVVMLADDLARDRLGVEEGEGEAGVLVARLAHAPDVHQEAVTRFDLVNPEAGRGDGRPVRVADEADRRGEGGELRLEQRVRVQSVPGLGFVRRGVDERAAVGLRAVREPPEPGEVVLAQERLVETRRRLPVLREVLHVAVEGDGLVVVAE